jgi:hypothetical protein
METGMAEHVTDSSTLKSKLIASASYDDDKRMLSVTFHDGRQRTIAVPRAMYENLITAQSPGWYYTRHISPLRKLL